MYKIIEKYLVELINNSTVDHPVWNMEKIRSGSKINWNYIDGCMMNCILELYKMTNNKIYLDFVDSYISHFVQNDGTINTYNPNKYVLDDICESKVLFDLYKYTNNEKYKKAIFYTYKHIENQPRTKEGNFWHKAIYPHQIWLDGLYMAMPFYTKYKNLTEEEPDYSDIINQYKNVESIMKDKKTGLYYHGYDSSKEVFWADKTTGLSKNFWLRAIGWFIVSIMDVYELLNDELSKLELKRIASDLASSLLKYQDEKTKMFYQVVDKISEKGNYVETSGSAMIAYSFLKGARLGVLDSSYKIRGKEIFDGICENFLNDNNGSLGLGNICLVAGLGPSDNLRRDGSYEYYISEPIVENEGKGVAPLIMAYIELMRG